MSEAWRALRERIDAAGEERLGEPDRVEAELVELVDDVAELLERQ